MKIRKAELDDLQSVLILVKEFAMSFQTIESNFENAYINLLDDKQATVYVAEHDTEIIGYCLGFVHDTFFANGKVSWLEEIMVDKNYRRSGVGTALVQAFESFSNQNGCRLAALATRRAGDFYSAIGYEESAAYYRKVL